ncbi:MAG: acyl carrier protein [Deltaproteobacteria bacterium]|nr:acyl carrier protein [Deltaproteobacteria bacterium]
MRSEQEIIEMFKAAVFEVDAKRVDHITVQTEIASLGLDSVQTMEVIGSIEEKLNVQFPDEDLETMRSVGDLTRLIRRLKS